jgi:hypothetical protein
MTQIAPNASDRDPTGHGNREELLARAAVFDRPDRSGRFAFFTRSDIFFSEILRSFWSALSKYRIARGGVFTFFTATDILLASPWSPGATTANEMPAQDCRARVP